MGENAIVPIFQTKDINLAAYLKMKGYKLKDCIRQGGTTIVFGFEDTDGSKRNKLMYEFYNNVGGFIEYTNCLKDMKSVLHSIGMNS